MNMLTQKEADAIARKLKAEIQKGRGHDIAVIRYQDQIIARYGIRRASKPVGHNYIPEQIFITFRQTLDLARCPLTKDEYFKILKSKGKLS